MARKTRFGIGVAVAVMVATLGMSALPAWAGNSASASLGIFSTYVWRGVQLSKEPVVQPSLGLTSGPVSLSLWANYDTDLETLNETDLTLSWARTTSPVSWSLGYVYYGLEGIDDTQEVYATATAAVPLSPSLAVYYDFDEGDGAFFTAGVSHAFPLPAGSTLKLAASASYCAGMATMGATAHGEEVNDFYSGEVSAALTIPLPASLSLEVRAAYAFPLSDDAADALEALSPEGEDRVVYGGVTISYAF